MKATAPFALVLALFALGCGNKNDDDKPAPPMVPTTPPAPVTVAPIAAEPPTAEPAPPPTGGAAAPPSTAHPASTSGPKKGQAQTQPIPSALVPKPLQPYVPKDLPKMPAQLPGM